MSEGRRLRRWCIGLPALALGGGAWAQIYVGGGEVQAVVLSNFPSTETPTLLVGDPPAAALPPTPAGPAAAGLPALIDEMSARAGVSPLLVHAVIAAESNFDPRARSPKGALGLMQLMPATAAQLGVAQPFDARQNVWGGTRYLRWLSERLGDRIDLVLAAYNAGLASVIKAGYRVPAIPETQAYVRRVLDRVACTRTDECRPNPDRRG